MNDKELLRTIMFRKEWNQTQLGLRIGVSAQQVSHVVNERSNLGKASRILAEQLLQRILQEKEKTA